jgi:UDP-N-acetylmuramoyl-tripeptide--D-alanyl-D-alanine ligase
MPVPWPLLVSTKWTVTLPQVVCADTQLALARIAAGLQQGPRRGGGGHHRQQRQDQVKTLVHGILQRAGKAYLNPGNRNNEIGLPLAVIDAPEDADFRHLRDGRRQAGRHRLPDRASRTPQVALVNNIAAAHLERMGSLLGVAETKGAIYDALPRRHRRWSMPTTPSRRISCSASAPAASLRFGLEPTPTCCTRMPRAALRRGHAVRACTRRRARPTITLPLPGRHNVMNALAAATWRWPPARRWTTWSPKAWPRAAGARAPDPAHAARRRGAGGRQLQRQPRLAGRGHRTLVQTGGEPGWCWATCASWAPGAALLHADIGAQARTRRHRSACTRWAS